MEFDGSPDDRDAGGVDLELDARGRRLAVHVGDRGLSSIQTARARRARPCSSSTSGVGGGSGGRGRDLRSCVVFLVFFGYDVAFEVLAAAGRRGSAERPARRARGRRQPIDVPRSARATSCGSSTCCPALLRRHRIPSSSRRRTSASATSSRARSSSASAGPLAGRAAAAGRPVPPVEAPAWDTVGDRAEELAAVRSFLERRDEIDPGRARPARDELADRLRPKVGGRRRQRSCRELFLEQLAAAKAARC